MSNLQAFPERYREKKTAEFLREFRKLKKQSRERLIKFHLQNGDSSRPYGDELFNKAMNGWASEVASLAESVGLTVEFAEDSQNKFTVSNKLGGFLDNF